MYILLLGFGLYLPQRSGMDQMALTFFVGFAGVWPIFAVTLWTWIKLLSVVRGCLIWTLASGLLLANDVD